MKAQTLPALVITFSVSLVSKPPAPSPPPLQNTKTLTLADMGDVFEPVQSTFAPSTYDLEHHLILPMERFTKYNYETFPFTDKISPNAYTQGAGGYWAIMPPNHPDIPQIILITEPGEGITPNAENIVEGYVMDDIKFTIPITEADNTKYAGDFKFSAKLTRPATDEEVVKRGIAANKVFQDGLEQAADLITEELNGSIIYERTRGFSAGSYTKKGPTEQAPPKLTLEFAYNRGITPPAIRNPETGEVDLWSGVMQGDHRPTLNEIELDEHAILLTDIKFKYDEDGVPVSVSGNAHRSDPHTATFATGQLAMGTSELLRNRVYVEGKPNPEIFNSLATSYCIFIPEADDNFVPEIGMSVIAPRALDWLAARERIALNPQSSGPDEGGDNAEPAGRTSPAPGIED
jgi:hypothetical protein